MQERPEHYVGHCLSFIFHALSDNFIIWQQLSAYKDPEIVKRCCCCLEQTSEMWSKWMIVGAIQGGLSISETAVFLGFSHTTVFKKNGVEKKCKNPVSSSSVGKNTLLMRQVRGEWPGWFKLTGQLKKNTPYMNGMQKSISDHTPHKINR